MDRTNLLYNGDFSLGNDGWSGTNITVSNGVITMPGGTSIAMGAPHFIPVLNGRRYRITFDLKINTMAANKGFYIALQTYDNVRSHINIAHTNKAISGCDTTLASELKNGDTTVTLTNATNWPSNRTYQGIGICNKLAWGYNRCTYRQPYTSKSSNTLTLTSAWSGGTFAAGTKVSEFEAGSTYHYPLIISNANLSTDWKSYECTFTGGNSQRYSCQYFLFSTLGEGHNYSMKNIRIEAVDDIQLNHDYKKDVNLTKQGILNLSEFNDIGMPIRYIRDTISGNTVNTGNHWNEFEVYNYVGENLAWGRNLTYTNGTYSNSVATDGKIDSNYISVGNGNNVWIMFDLGYVENIHKIKIWHYYPDGRTYYNNVTEVSTDGTNWITVYKGQKPETAAGNEIILTSPTLQVQNNGEVFSNELIEI